MTDTETKWADRIRQWKESGKPLAEFAAGKPFKASTLRWWGTELRKRSGRGRDSSPRARAAAVGTGTIKMARVVRTVRPGQEGRLVVEAAGVRIVVERGFDSELLAQVVRAIGGAR